jgi:hypothetical protein
VELALLPRQSFRSRRLRLEQSRLVREDDCLGAVTQVELLKDVRDVRLDGRVADVELLRDLRVRVPGRDREEDLPLAGRELVDLFGGEGRGMRVKCLITRFVIVGDSSASPAATVRTAPISCSGGSSLTKPLAGALLGARLGFNATEGLLAVITTIVGAAVGGNLSLVSLDIAWDWQRRDRFATAGVRKTLEARPSTG